MIGAHSIVAAVCERRHFLAVAAWANAVQLGPPARCFASGPASGPYKARRPKNPLP